MSNPCEECAGSYTRRPLTLRRLLFIKAMASEQHFWEVPLKFLMDSFFSFPRIIFIHFFVYPPNSGSMQALSNTCCLLLLLLLFCEFS